MAKMQNKVMSAKEAISKFVQDGDHLVIGNYTVGTCAELVFEVIRQQKKGLTLYSQSGVFDVEVLIAGGCVDKLVTTYVYRAGGKEGGSAVERALRAGTLVMEIILISSITPVSWPVCTVFLLCRCWKGPW